MNPPASTAYSAIKGASEANASLAPDVVAPSSDDARIVRSVCPYDCPDCCGLLFTVENGRITRVAGDPDHAFTRGTLCPKMSRYERTIYNERRLLTPLLRTGKKGGGDFAPISWEEAIDRISAAWRRVRRDYGDEAILPYSYAGTMGLVQHDAYHALFHALGASRLDRTICSPSKRQAYADVYGATRAIRPQEAQDSDLIILWSLSMLSTNIHFKHDCDIARKRGAKIIVIDTYETATAQYADEHCIIEAGTDGALALGLLHILHRDGLEDRDFIRRYVEGYEALAEQILPRYTPAYTASVTGLSADGIERLAHLYATARAPFIRLGSGLCRYTNGSMSCRLIGALPAAVGAWKRKGGGILYSVPGSSAFDKSFIQRPDLQPHPTRLVNMIELGNVLTTLTGPPVKSLFVYSSNPACTAPDQNKVLEGLLRDDLFTVVHERFMTDTARYADIVLPATTSAEHDDVYAAYGHYTLAAGYKAIEPLGESKSNWDTARLLAKAMDIDDPLFDRTERELTETHIRGIRWETPVDIDAILRGESVELSLKDDAKLDYRTATGKIRIANDVIEPHLPDYFPPTGDDAPFQLVNAPDPRILDSSFNEREELTRGNTMLLFMHPADAQELDLSDGERVTCSNVRGEADFTLKITSRTKRGVLVSEGVWWEEHTPRCGINRLTSQRTTDKGGGATFYDVRVHVRKSATRRDQAIAAEGANRPLIL